MRVTSVIFFTSAVLSVVLAQQLVLRDHEVWWRDGLWNALWCSVSVKEGETFVKNLKFEDFLIKEIAYDDKGKILGEKPVSFSDKSYYQFNGPGFWKKSINSDKLDIVFLIDATGSHGKEDTEHRKAIARAR